MAVGDAALAAGMDLVSGTSLANTLDTEINKTRDYIADKTSDVTPVAKGGTGSTTAAGARSALGITLANLGATASAIPSNGSNVQGDIDAHTNQIANLNTAVNGKAPNGHTHEEIVQASRRFGINSNVGGAPGWATDQAIATNSHLFVPNSSAATASWQVAYINGDGRLCRGASSERYKKFISPFEPQGLGDLFPAFQRFKMRADGITPADEKWHYGYIAEQMARHPDQSVFVVWRDVDDSGEVVPDSIDFIGLLLAQTAQLHQRAVSAEEKLAAIEDRLDVIEARSEAHVTRDDQS